MASAEPLASYAEPPPTEEQSKPKALLLKLSSPYNRPCHWGYYGNWGNYGY